MTIWNLIYMQEKQDVLVEETKKYYLLKNPPNRKKELEWFSFLKAMSSAIEFLFAL